MFRNQMDGLDIRKIDGDGNCLFNSISGQINGDIHGGRQMGIRNQLKAYLSQNMDSYPLIREMMEARAELIKKKGVSQAKLVHYGTLTEFYHLNVDRKFGGDLAISIASARYQMNVVVHPIGGDRITIPENEPYPRTMHLRYNRSSRHYDLLVDPNSTWTYDVLLDQELPYDEDDLRPTSDEDFYQLCIERGFDMDGESDEKKMEDDEDDDMEKQQCGKKAVDDGMKQCDDDKINNSSDDELPCVENDPKYKNLMKSPLFPYLARNIYHAGRSTVDIVIIVRNNISYSSLSDIISQGKPNHIGILVSYSSKMMADILHDEDLSRKFRVFSRRVHMAVKKSMFERIRWLASIIIAPLLLSTLNFACEGVKIYALCKSGVRSIASIILDSCWDYVAEETFEDVKAILENPSIFWHHQCRSNCEYKDHQWHIRLNEFRELNFLTKQRSGFFKEYRPFDRQNFLNSEVFTSLRNFYFDPTKNTIEELEQLLNTNAEKNRKDKYYTYLALIIDGHDMERFQHASINDLLDNKKLQKALYGGYTKNQTFRQGHLESDSAINQILTKTSRLFNIRSKEEKSIPKAFKDEAVMIESLKGVLYLNHLNAETPLFVLLNKRSECSRLLQLTIPEIQNVLDFCENQIPVFIPVGSIPTKTHFGIFTGNYQEYVEIKIPRRPFRSFADVQHIYDQLLFKAHK